MIDHLSPVEKVLDSLENYTGRGDGFRARCPAHRGVSATSLSVKEGDDGRALVKCFANCGLGDIVRALGLNVADLYPHNGQNGSSLGPAKKARVRENPLTTDELPAGTYWEFTSPTGDVLYIQRHKREYYRKVGEDLWRGGEGALDGVPKVLYNLPELVAGVQAGKPIYHLEGPKDVETARARLGVVATTSGATSSWRPEFKSWYVGADVVVVPDNDAPGLKYAETVARDLAEVARSVKVARLPGLEKAEDLTDWLDAGHTPEEFFAVVERTEVIGSGSGSPISAGTGTDTVEPPKLVRFRDIERAERPKDIIEGLMPADSLTLWYGAGGVAKSYMALLAGMTIAGAADDWLGFAVKHGPVVYGDFELDASEHGWRSHRIAKGLDLEELPEHLYYMELTARKPREAFDALYNACVGVGAVLLIIDSVTVALEGDVEVARDFIGFVNQQIGRLRKSGVTVLALDHQGKLQAGERYQQKSAFGTSFKRHLSRSYAQLESRSHGEGFLSLTMRHQKQNFAPLVDPFGILVEFEPGKVLISKEELLESDLAGEETVTAYNRVYNALKSFENEEGTKRDIAEATGLADGTVKKELAALKGGGKVWDTGKLEGRMHVVTAKEPKQASNASGSGAVPVLGPMGEPEPEPLLTVGRALEALRHGNGPRKAYENLCRGDQDLESVAKSVLVYHGMDAGHWQQTLKSVLGALEALEKEGDPTPS